MSPYHLERKLELLGLVFEALRHLALVRSPNSILLKSHPLGTGSAVSPEDKWFPIPAWAGPFSWHASSPLKTHVSKFNSNVTYSREIFPDFYTPLSIPSLSSPQILHSPVLGIIKHCFLFPFALLGHNRQIQTVSI